MTNDMQQFYAPPQDSIAPGFSDATLPGANVALYKPTQVALAAFLGTPLGAGILLAINESRLGRKTAARNSILISALASAAFMGIGFALPANAPTLPLGLLALWAARAIATRRQGALVDAHVAAGGKCPSNWAAAGIGIASLVGVMIPVFVIAFAVTLAQG